jgi:hypothetical protein
LGLCNVSCKVGKLEGRGNPNPKHWLFFANPFLQPLSQKVWSSCRGQRNQCFPYQ